MVRRVNITAVPAADPCILRDVGGGSCRLCPIASMPALVPDESVDRCQFPHLKFAGLPNILYETEVNILPFLILSSFDSIYIPINKIGVDCLILDELLYRFEEEVFVL